MIPWFRSKYGGRLEVDQLCKLLSEDCQTKDGNQTDDKFDLVSALSQILDIPSQIISIGPNQLSSIDSKLDLGWENGGWDFWVFDDGVNFNPALFVTYMNDELQGRHVIGVWKFNNSSLLPARAGLVHSPIVIDPGQIVVASFDYKTQNLKNSETSLIFSMPTDQSLEFVKHLPQTNNEWCNVIFFIINQTTVRRFIRPSLWLWGVGNVDWGDVRLNNLLVGDQPISLDGKINTDQLWIHCLDH